jgi:hypothetical protein
MMVLLEYDTRNFLSPSEISGFHGEVDENYAFLGHYAACGG